MARKSKRTIVKKITKRAVKKAVNRYWEKNEYPSDLLKKIAKAKKFQKATATEILKNNQWVNDFLINYCWYGTES